MAKGKFNKWLTADGLLQLEAWARDGLTDEEISKNIGISRSTLSEWKNRFSDISDALKKGKEIVDIHVENSLLKRALGYEYIEVTKELVNGQMVAVKEVTKHIMPDVTAMIFWLKNRNPEKWRDSRQLRAEASVRSPFSDLTTEELRILIDYGD